MSRPKPAPHPLSPARRPLGQVTRGKTMGNRLRRADIFLLKYAPNLLARHDAPFDRAYFVDLGYGATPTTTLESLARLRRINPHLPILGVEIDAARVAAAQPYAEPLLEFRLGGFNMPLGTWPDGAPEMARVVRAFNVLRQYEPDAVAAAYANIAARVLPGGLLIEGTSDPPGQRWVAHVMRRTDAPATQETAWRREALVFSTNFRPDFDPTAFQPVLPKDLIHQVIPGAAIHAFFAAWKRAAELTTGHSVWGKRAWFVAAAQALAGMGYTVNLRPHWLQKGYLLWMSPPPVDGLRHAPGA